MTSDEFQKIILQKFDGIDERLDKIDKKLEKLDKGQVKLEKGQNDIKDMIRNLESQNANNHLKTYERIDNLANDLNIIENVTSKNWNDITKLKAKKIKKAK